MKKQTEHTLKTEEGFGLKIRSRDSKPVTIHIPADTLASLEKIATGRDTTVEALLKLYIGQSMRQDLAKLSAEPRVGENCAGPDKTHSVRERSFCHFERNPRGDSIVNYLNTKKDSQT